MKLDELRKKFIVDEDSAKANLESLVTKALKHCAVDNKGRIHFTRKNLPTRPKVKLVLVARAIASQLDDKISAEVTVDELRDSTGLPRDQVRARANDAVKEKFAETVGRGKFRALFHKIEPFLDSLPQK